MSEELEIITEEEDEDIDLSDRKKIDFSGKDSDIDGLYRQYQKGRLLIQPDYQRKYVWDPKKASLLIESILMNIPIPIIYLAATSDGKINVIDGQQRLTSIFSFIDGVFPDGKAFKLTGLQVLTGLKNKTFKDLDEIEQNKLLDYSIRTITFSSDSDPDLQYEIFTRLNSGSVSLNDQELRNCIYRGKFNEFIKQLASDKDFLSLLGYKEPHSRMKDVELVLRFISFYKKTYINYKGTMKLFFNDTMREYANIDDVDMKNIQAAFKTAVTNIYSLLGECCFRRFKLNDGEYTWESKILNVALYDILMDSMARIPTTVLMRHLDSIREAYIDLMVSNQEFIDAISFKTSDATIVKKRFKIWNDTLDEVIKDDKADKRCFSRAFKQKLYDANSTCAICGQHISSLDDSAVDHIEQYWMGGKTIPDNARLVHRYCNWSRSRKE
ncbi:MAG: DUF262 domain-containing protein [Pseudobutyrivibrio sp.]|nr:DUF262 domain-containing protein [Pseudobutyrivibrio sp.]